MILRQELKKLRSLLLRDQKKLESEIKTLDKADFGSDIDSGEEEADETEELITNQGIKATLKNRLRNINWALHKIITGKYGKCEKCAGEISLELLRIDPESRLCQDCKAKLR